MLPNIETIIEKSLIVTRKDLYKCFGLEVRVEEFAKYFGKPPNFVESCLEKQSVSELLKEHCVNRNFYKLKAVISNSCF